MSISSSSGLLPVDVDDDHLLVRIKVVNTDFPCFIIDSDRKRSEGNHCLLLNITGNFFAVFCSQYYCKLPVFALVVSLLVD